jgi:hypothetical protein
LVHVMQRTDALDFLMGHWRLIHLMSDGKRPLGMFEAREAFVASDDGPPGKVSARYDEKGIVRPTLSTRSALTARRVLCMRLRRRPDGIALFGWPVVIRVDLRSSHAEHWRGEDLQMIDTEVLSESWIQERWSVHEPDTEIEATTDHFRSTNEQV